MIRDENCNIVSARSLKKLPGRWRTFAPICVALLSSRNASRFECRPAASCRTRRAKMASGAIARKSAILSPAATWRVRFPQRKDQLQRVSDVSVGAGSRQPDAVLAFGGGSLSRLAPPLTCQAQPPSRRTPLPPTCCFVPLAAASVLQAGSSGPAGWHRRGGPSLPCLAGDGLRCAVCMFDIPRSPWWLFIAYVTTAGASRTSSAYMAGHAL